MLKSLCRYLNCCKKDKNSTNKNKNPENLCEKSQSFVTDKSESDIEKQNNQKETELHLNTSHSNQSNSNSNSNRVNMDQYKSNDSLYSINEEPHLENEVDIYNLTNEKINGIIYEKKDNIEIEMDKIIVPDNYIRKDEKDKLIWVIKIIRRIKRNLN